ncbi:MAG: hypothetical protein JXB36_08240 [Gammaproteobacteria bacterium]|nr:hypothetical protein [Gammaproteobacteria bacterium]
MDGADKRALRRWLPVAVIVAAWAASLPLPALAVRGGPTLTGWEMLLQGWQGAGRGVYAWYANPLFAVAVVAAVANRPRAALVASGFSILLALTTFVAEDVLHRSMERVPELTLLVGFYVWVAALLAAFLSAWRTVYLQLRDNLRPRAGGRKSFHFWD